LKIPSFRLLSVVVVLLLIPGWSAADARGNKPETLRRPGTATIVRTTSYAYRYQRGFLTAQYGTIYGKDGVVQGYEEIEYFRNAENRLQGVERRSLNADEELVRTHTTRNLFEGRHRVGVDRFNRRADGSQIHREELRYHVQVEGVGQVEETKVFDQEDEIKQVRYTIVDRNDGGKVVARDTSAYDRDGAQQHRQLITYGYSRTGLILSESRTRFDRNDDIDHKEVAEYSRPSPDIMVQFWTQSDGEDEVQGYREVVYEKTREGRTKSIETTYYGDDGVATRTYYEEFAYDADNRVIARRAHSDIY
jgi:hypothetical protein